MLLKEKYNALVYTGKEKVVRFPIRRLRCWNPAE